MVGVVDQLAGGDVTGQLIVLTVGQAAILAGTSLKNSARVSIA